MWVVGELEAPSLVRAGCRPTSYRASSLQRKPGQSQLRTMRCFLTVLPACATARTELVGTFREFAYLPCDRLRSRVPAVRAKHVARHLFGRLESKEQPLIATGSAATADHGVVSLIRTSK